VKVLEGKKKGAGKKKETRQKGRREGNVVVYPSGLFNSS
jgi:hypothetical protein